MEKWWRRWIPDSVNRKFRKQLEREHGWKTKFAAVLGAGAFVAGFLLYAFGVFRSNDWRGAGLAFGGVGAFPFLFLVLSSCWKGWDAVKETCIYFTIEQKIPPVVAAGLLVLSLACGIAAIVHLIQPH